MSCRLLPPPSCEDGIRNCHHGSCELLIDCGGVCNPCPDELNRTEYPRKGVCKDNVCEMNELFTCSDCYMFWVICISALISILVILYILRRRKLMIIARQNELKRRERIERIKENIIEIERNMELRDYRNARAIFRKTERMVSLLKETETKAIRRKLWSLKKELVGDRRYKK